jgi:hypothetical protein
MDQRKRESEAKAREDEAERLREKAAREAAAARRMNPGTSRYDCFSSFFFFF